MHAGPPQPQPQPPYGAPMPGARRSTSAVPALVLGITSLVMLPTVFLCCPLVPVPFSVIAIVLGLQTKREVRIDPSLGGVKEAQIGFVMGIVSLVLAILITLALVVFFGVAILTTEG